MQLVIQNDPKFSWKKFGFELLLLYYLMVKGATTFGAGQREIHSLPFFYTNIYNSYTGDPEIRCGKE